jgi:IS30 family transposase
MSNGKKWTSEEDERLLDLKAKGLTLRLIAKSLNRTAASVDSRIRELRRAEKTSGV